MKLLSALYLIYMLVTSAIGAFLASDAFYHMVSVTGPAQHPWLANTLHIVLFSVLLFQGLLLHLKVPGSGYLSLGLLILVGVILAVLHFVM